MEQLMTVTEAAAAIGCDGSQVRRLYMRGTLTGRRVGKRMLLLDASSVMAYRDTPRTGPGYPRGRPRKQPPGDLPTQLPSSVSP